MLFLNNSLANPINECDMKVSKIREILNDWNGILNTKLNEFAIKVNNKMCVNSVNEMYWIKDTRSSE